MQPGSEYMKSSLSSSSKVGDDSFYEPFSMSFLQKPAHENIAQHSVPLEVVGRFANFSSSGKYEEPQWGYEPRLAETLSMRIQPRNEETGYGYFGARYMDHELMTMWLSVDPMADKYPSISPYAYCSWNPMKLVDPNGKEIFYKEGRSYFMCQKNAEGVYDFYNCRTGELYAGENRDYVDDLTKSLNQLKEGKYGNKSVSYFEGHPNRPLMICKEKENNANGATINWNNTDRISLTVGTTLSDPVQIENTEPFVVLGHEMAHVRDAYKFGNEFNNMSRMKKEQSAMLTENLIRREHGIRQRTFYGLKDDGKSVDYESYPAIVLPKPLPFRDNGNKRIDAWNNIILDF